MVPDLLRSSRPFSWVNTALPFAAVAWAVHPRWTFSLVLGMLYFLAPYNLLLYGINDLFDYESDRRNPRKGGSIEGGLVPPSHSTALLVTVAALNVPLLIVLSVRGGWITGVLLVVTVGVALAYSAPPLRTKEIPGLDSITSSLHFVLPAIVGGVLVSRSLQPLPWQFLVAFFLWGIGSHALGAIQDVRYDREAGIGSIAVGLGENATARFSCAAYTAATILVAAAGGLAIIAAMALVPYVLLAGSCLGENSVEQSRRAWRGFLGMNLLVGFILTQLLLHVWHAGDTSGLTVLAIGALTGVGFALVNTIAAELSMRVGSTEGESGRESVSVIVPVRDEAHHIEACLQAIRAQRYAGPVEILVVDDGSTDNTADIARSALGTDGRVVAAGEKPGGWTGKCWAAQVGAARTDGEILIFVDADTLLEPSALGVLVRELKIQGGGLVSLLTRYVMASLAERALVPAFVMVQLGFVPIALMNRRRGQPPLPALAYGPCMAAWRADYVAAGGHRAISASDREDVDMGRLMARGGYPVRLLRGANLAATRHYRTIGEVAGCWRRTYYAYGGHSLALALFGMLGSAFVFLAPLLLPFLAFAQGDREALAISLIALAGLVCLRVVIAVRERQPLSTILWHPITWLCVPVFQARSIADGIRGRPPQWRGRRLVAEVSS